MQELAKELDDSTPLGQMRGQRDAFALAWGQALEDVLSNLKGIRADYSILRCKLEEASRSGSRDTDRVIAQIQESTTVILNAILNGFRSSTVEANVILDAINAKPSTPPPTKPREPWWRFW